MRKEKEDINKEYFDNLMTGLKGLQENTNGLINSVLTPEAKEQMTPEQLEFLNQGMSAFSLNGKKPFERVEELTKILRNNANNI